MIVLVGINNLTNTCGVDTTVSAQNSRTDARSRNEKQNLKSTSFPRDGVWMILINYVNLRFIANTAWFEQRWISNHKGEWGRMDHVLNGPRTEWTTYWMDHVLNGPRTEWTTYWMDHVLNGPRTEWTTYWMDHVLNGPRTEWTTYWMDHVLNGPRTEWTIEIQKNI